MTQEILPGCRLVPLTVKGDERGRLVAIEARQAVPWSIERVYYIYATQPGVERGHHAHRRLSQLAVAVAGSCTMLVDNGRERRSVRLDRPDLALHIPPMVWHEISEISPDCVLMVVADAGYDESDYIRDYSSFRAAVDG